ncbi:uncharacterized protein A1O9_02973 [Exophiala aquamarina CBS 119918]|uniref:Importin N-terminal domain-containing protein n=1 Tax=Exophiala aquamarina CBS 119918 TaxID=1182545 RepID=A0A072PNU3_9EURO|nr:uncharacterized protein A1O9_02973 [Exophiala aquamarina CBS 119918]KEF61407.1 hypothetical protein A1O9_02973 [Exophiala aquamarina CBS 119918]
MEQLIAELYHPANQASPERVNALQRQIQQIQRQKSAWQLGLDLLHNDEAVVRFYGALTLTIKINADWESDEISQDQRMRSYLIEALVTHYVHLVKLPDATFVLQKLCSTLVTLFARSDSGWMLPVRHVLGCLLNDQYLPQNDLPEMTQLLNAAKSCSLSQLKGVIMVITTLAEDTTGSSTNTKEEGGIQERLSMNCIDTWEVYDFCLHRLLEVVVSNQHPEHPGHHDNANSSVSLNDSFEIIKMILKGVPLWASITRNANYLDKDQRQNVETISKRCINSSMEAFHVDDLVSGVLQMFVSLHHSSAKLVHDAVPSFPISITGSQRAQSLLESLVRGDFEPEGILYVDFLDTVISQVDTTNSEYLYDDRYRIILQSMLKLLRCEGIAAIDDPVCQIALEKINEMVEGFTDWEEDGDARGLLQAITIDACQAALVKVRLPFEQMSAETQDWDADDRAKFQDFRYDVQDYFQSAFTLLGNSLIEEIVNTVIVPQDPPNWSIFEAGVFSLTAFSDTMSAEPDIYDGLITTVLSSPGWRCILESSQDIPDRARQTGIRFITENVVYLQRHPDRLISMLNFLFSSLHLQASSVSASRAIYNLCDSHRSILAAGLPQFMAALHSIADSGEAERHRIYAAVAAVIQALPREELKTVPLSELLSAASGPLLRIQVDDGTGQELLAICTDTMQTLASIGKGLRASSDVPVELDASAPDQPSFWIHGPGQTIQANVLAIYGSVVQTVNKHADNIFVEACCDFIRSGFTEEHPSAFKFRDTIGLDLVSSLISIGNPNIDSTMACASSFMASVDQSSIEACISGLLHPIAINQQAIVAEFRQSGQLLSSTFSSSSLEFQARLITKWGDIWYSMPDSDRIMGIAMELSLILLADPDTLPRRSSASFLAAFAGFSGPDGVVEPDLQVRIQGVLQEYGPRILGLVLRLVGGECARSELEIISDTLKRFIQKQFMFTKQVLREAVEEERGILSEKAFKVTTIDQRKRFLAQLETLRGSRKTNDVVKDFWIACRGSGFGYIA